MRTKSIILGIVATFILATGLISASAAAPATRHGLTLSTVAKVRTNVAVQTEGKAKIANHGGAVSAIASKH